MTKIERAKRAIKRRRDQLAFDKLPESRKRELRRVGMDPYEPEQIREKKKAAELERRKREFNQLPKEAREKLTALGVAPGESDGVIIRRQCGAISAK